MLIYANWFKLCKQNSLAILPQSSKITILSVSSFVPLSFPEKS